MSKTRLVLFISPLLFAFAFAVAQSGVDVLKNRSANMATQTPARLSVASAKLSAQQGGETSPKTKDVSIDNFNFSPAALNVPVGTTVTWVNKDDVPHTVVSTDRVFASHVLDTDEKFSNTFSKAGKYEYFCSVHPKMTATVVVK